MKSIKRILVIVMLAIIGTTAANAEWFRFGIKAGLNINRPSFSSLGENFTVDNRCGYTVGLTGQFQLPLVGLGIDLSAMYTRMNSEIGLPENQNPTEMISGEPVENVLNKNFIEIPLNIRYKVSIPMVGNIISPYIFTGPNFAFALNKEIFNDIKNKTCQIAWNVGIGVELFRHLQVSGAYAFGLNNAISSSIANVAGLNQASYIKAKNNYWTITAAYIF